MLERRRITLLEKLEIQKRSVLSDCTGWLGLGLRLGYGCVGMAGSSLDLETFPVLSGLALSMQQ